MQGLFKGRVAGGAPAALYAGVRGKGQGAGVALGTLYPSTSSPVIFVLSWGYFLEAGSHTLLHTCGGIPTGMRVWERGSCTGEGLRLYLKTNHEPLKAEWGMSRARLSEDEFCSSVEERLESLGNTEVRSNKEDLNRGGREAGQKNYCVNAINVSTPRNPLAGLGSQFGSAGDGIGVRGTPT